MCLSSTIAPWLQPTAGRFIARGRPWVPVVNTEEAMKSIDRSELARRALDGYLSGPAAPTEATTRAMSKVGNAVALVLVEGISDQIALETAAAGRGRDLETERVV